MSLVLIGVTPSGDAYFSDEDGVVRAHTRVGPGEALVTSRPSAELALAEAGAEVLDVEVDSWSDLENRADQQVRRVEVDVGQLPIGPTTMAHAPSVIRAWMDQPALAPAIPALIRRLLASDDVRADPSLVAELSELAIDYFDPVVPRVERRPSPRLSEALSFYNGTVAA